MIIDGEVRADVRVRRFTTKSLDIAGELEAVCSSLKQKLSIASKYLQDSSERDALSVISDLIEETMDSTSKIRMLTSQIRESAVLLEESDTLLCGA